MAAKVHQLLAGRDFAARAPTNVDAAKARELAAVHAMAAQMANYIYLVEGRDKTAFAVDVAWDVDGVFRFAEERGLRIVGVGKTHRHQDHTGGKFPFGREPIVVPGLKECLDRNVPVFVGVDDADAVAKQCGVDRARIRAVREGDEVFPGITVMHTPGHTPGSIVFRVGVDDALITGDTLFIGSCGRVDLRESDPSAMLRSLARLAALPRHVRVFPGHNYARPTESTIGKEIDFNFMMQDAIQAVEEEAAAEKGGLSRNNTSAVVASSSSSSSSSSSLLSLGTEYSIPLHEYVRRAHADLMSFDPEVDAWPGECL